MSTVEPPPQALSRPRREGCRRGLYTPSNLESFSFSVKVSPPLPHSQNKSENRNTTTASHSPGWGGRKTLTTSSVGEDAEQRTERFMSCWWEHNMAQPLWKQPGIFLKTSDPVSLAQGSSGSSRAPRSVSPGREPRPPAQYNTNWTLMVLDAGDNRDWWGVWKRGETVLFRNGQVPPDAVSWLPGMKLNLALFSLLNFSEKLENCIFMLESLQRSSITGGRGNGHNLDGGHWAFSRSNLNAAPFDLEIPLQGTYRTDVLRRVCTQDSWQRWLSRRTGHNLNVHPEGAA